MYKGDCDNCPYVNLDSVMEIINDMNIPFTEIHNHLCKDISFGYINKKDYINVSQIKCTNYKKNYHKG